MEANMLQIPALLEDQCPALFAAYKKMLEGSSNNLPAISGSGESRLAATPEPYLDTNIYKASRQIKKMQKLYSNILTTWPEKLLQKGLIE